MSVQERWAPKLLLLLLALAVSGLSAMATALPTGGVSVVPNNQTGGYTVLATTSFSYSFFDATTGAQNTGTVKEEVVKGLSPSTGGLSFLYQVQNTSSPSSGNIIEAITGASFKGFTLDVGWVSTGTGFAVGTVNASGDRTNSGTVVQIDFDTQPLAAGQTSDVEIINTNALKYTKGSIGVLDGGGASGAGFEPTARVPEPSGRLLLGLGLLGLMAI